MAFDHWVKRKPRFGDHIRVSRGAYCHHGIYVSDTEVINFNGEPGKSTKDLGRLEQMQKAMIVISTLAEFLGGGELEINTTPGKNSPAEVVRIARSKLGTRRGEYNLVTNNCEHFCNDCRNNNHASKQVQKAVAGLSATILAVGAAITGVAISKSNKNKHNRPQIADTSKTDKQKA